MKFSLTLIFLVISQFCGAQFYETTPARDTTYKAPTIQRDYEDHTSLVPNVAIYGMAGYHAYNNFSQKLVFGLEGEKRYGDHWSGIYRVQGGEGYYHMPLSVPFAIGAFLLVSSVTKDFSSAALARFILFVPEGVAFTFELLPGVNIKPYVNPLGLGFYRRDSGFGTSYSESYATLSMGGQVEIRAFENFSFSGFSEYRISYNGELKGQQTGFRLGYIIND